MGRGGSSISPLGAASFADDEGDGGPRTKGEYLANASTDGFDELDVERFSLPGATDLPSPPLKNFLITLKVEMPYEEDSDEDEDYSTFEDLLWEALATDDGEWEGLSVLKMPAEDYVEAWIEDVSEAQAVARYKAIIARYPSLPKVLKFEIEEV